MIKSLKGMGVREAQMVLASSGYYSGAIDGDGGPATMRAVEITERNAGAKVSRWSKERRLIGAVQRILNAQGFEAGTVDGYSGHNTQEAMTAWLADKLKLPTEVSRSPAERIRSDPAQLAWPRQANVRAFYGPAGGAACTAGMCYLPFPFRLSWATGTRVSRFACHTKVVDQMTSIFNEAAQYYGENRFRELRLDLFGGCYNYRKMRGGSAMSMHAYGIAVDLDPERNMLRWDHTRAAFARPEYEPFWRIVMSNGATPAGYAWNGDWMHFQFARL